MKIFNSSLFVLSLMHQRFSPAMHRFKYGIFMFYLDLDELSAIDSVSKLVGFNKNKLYGFFNSDHFEPTNEDTKSKVGRFLRTHGIAEQPKKIMLLTNLRIFNYVFNPASFYFCFDEQNIPIALITEVTNTFNEKKTYFVPANYIDGGSAVFRSTQKKEFYVSPFSPLDLDLHFDIRVPDQDLIIKISESENGKKIFESTLSGYRIPFSDIKVLWLTWINPLITLRIIFLIHWHALLLFFKGVPFFPKEEKSYQQTHVINPHSSLAAENRNSRL